MIDIDVNDQLSPFFQYLLANNPDFLRKSAKSTGYMIIQRTKKEVRSGHPGGESWPKRIPYAIRNALEPGTKKNWYGRLISAQKGQGSSVGYEYNNGVLKVGWSSKSAAKIGNDLESGFQRTVGRFIRKKFSLSGYPLKWATRDLNIPARPVFEPVGNVIKPELPKFIEGKLMDYIQKGTNFAKASAKRRTYRVYG